MKTLSIVSLLMLLAFACQPQNTVKEAIARIYPTAGNQAAGLITFSQEGKSIKITGEISGLTPGIHGFHIHQFGNLSSADGTSAGGHYNPLNARHGAPTDKERHVGDLGNITADDNGNATINLTDNVISLNGKYSITGRAVVIHAGQDDFTTQPTGNAGARVGYGVIGIAKE